MFAVQEDGMYTEPIELRGWSPELWKYKEARDHRGHRILERREEEGSEGREWQKEKTREIYRICP